MNKLWNNLTRNMSSGKLILLVAAGIVIAAVALKLLSIIVNFILSLLIALAILAAVVLVIYFLVRSILPKRTSP